MKPKSIWVLYGGNSTEREVSLRSGKGIAEALMGCGFEVKGFDVRPGTSLLNLDWSRAPDLVFVGLHGAFGEDGTVQGFLESLEIPYVGSGILASALSMHKGHAKKIMSSRGIPCPLSFDVDGAVQLNELLRNSAFTKNAFSTNWFLKPARQGSTVGIQRFRPLEAGDPVGEFRNLMSRAFAYDSYVLVEEWIEGPEITVPVLEGRALPVVEIRPHSKFYDYKSKYTAGETEYLCPAPLNETTTQLVQHIAEQAFEALGCVDYGRVDMIVGSNGPRVLEMNTLPGMTETSLVPKSAKAANMDYAQFLERLVTGSYQRQKNQKRAASAP
jgi:D-alanine-D-alanine ligase